MELVLKTSDVLKHPWVQIPPLSPFNQEKCQSWSNEPVSKTGNPLYGFGGSNPSFSVYNLLSEVYIHGRVAQLAECSGLLNRQPFIAVRGFESLLYRHMVVCPRGLWYSLGKRVTVSKWSAGSNPATIAKTRKSGSFFVRHVDIFSKI